MCAAMPYLSRLGPWVLSCPALSSPVWFCPVLSRLVQSIGRSIGRAVGQGSPSVSVMGGLRSVAWGGGGSIGM